ncbi:Uncharacterised protein [Candidatus Norongarragalina meridionalis]|nr:Uncharacterised protein [Candidatus Norongarragalina meridionalis]
MFREITYSLVFGKPLIMWMGLLVLLCVLATATMGFLALKGKASIETHKRVAIATIALALLHGTLGILAYF